MWTCPRGPTPGEPWANGTGSLCSRSGGDAVGGNQEEFVGDLVGHLPVVIADLVSEFVDGFGVVAEADEDVAVGDGCDEGGAEVASEAVVEGGEEEAGGVVAVHGLEEDEVDLSLFVVGCVSVDGLGAGDEVGHGGFVEVVDLDLPRVEDGLGEVGDGSVVVEGVGDSEAVDERLGDNAAGVDVLGAVAEEDGEDAVLEVLEASGLVGGSLAGAEELDDPALDLALGLVGLEGDDAVEVFEGSGVAVELEGEGLLGPSHLDEGELSADHLDDLLNELLACRL